MTSPTLLYALAAERAEALGKKLPDATVSWVVRTESTSDDAKRAALDAGGRVHVFVADHQTKGRGRNGNAWVSDPGAGLLLSVLFFPTLEPMDAPRVTLAIGAAIAERIDGVLRDLGSAARVQVKWPNDLEIDRKKLAGILVEAQTRGEKLSSVVVGVGINVVPSYLDDDVAARSCALTVPDEVRRLDRADLAFRVVDAILSATRTFEAEGLKPFLDALETRDALVGGKIRVGDVEGVAAGVAPDGCLRVRTADGEVAVSAGSVERIGS
jgi:BirA family biotin operon repressor/biotin-[acetyl-CoA-carboxylase] ligase